MQTAEAGSGVPSSRQVVPHGYESGLKLSISSHRGKRVGATRYAVATEVMLLWACLLRE